MSKTLGQVAFTAGWYDPIEGDDYWEDAPSSVKADWEHGAKAVAREVTKRNAAILHRAAETAHVNTAELLLKLAKEIEES